MVLNNPTLNDSNQVKGGQTAFGFTIQVWSQNNTPVDPVVDFTVWHA
jgi:hypothetical protein